MTYTIRDNNGNIVFSVENTTPEVSFESIDSSLKDLTEYSNKLNKSIEAFNFISDTKAMESFGYRATEGFGEKVKEISGAILNKLKEFFKKLYTIIVKIVSTIKEFSRKFFSKRKNVDQNKTKIITTIKESKSDNIDEFRKTYGKIYETLFNNEHMNKIVTANKNIDYLCEIIDLVYDAIRNSDTFNVLDQAIDLMNDQELTDDFDEFIDKVLDFFQAHDSNDDEKIAKALDTLGKLVYETANHIDEMKTVPEIPGVDIVRSMPIALSKAISYVSDYQKVHHLVFDLMKL